MTDLPPYPGTPRWVKVFGIITLIAVMLFVLVHLTGGGLAHLIDHGMGGHSPPPSVTKHGAQQP